MSYVLQAILADPKALARARLPGARIVPLPQNLAMIPLTALVRRGLHLADCPLTENEALQPLPDTLLELLGALSAGTRAVYVEARFWAGAGLQACVRAEMGQVRGLEVGPVAINSGLAFLGVDAGGAVDEFEAIGLGRHRETDGWVTG